jgi:hypothetical protein
VKAIVTRTDVTDHGSKQRERSHHRQKEHELEIVSTDPSKHELEIVLTDPTKHELEVVSTDPVILRHQTRVGYSFDRSSNSKTPDTGWI